MEDPNTTAVLRRFGTVSALAKYSKNNDKIYPKAEAKAKGPLRLMLRELFGRSGRLVV
jgi:hypothetical protein